MAFQPVYSNFMLRTQGIAFGVHSYLLFLLQTVIQYKKLYDFKYFYLIIWLHAVIWFQVTNNCE